MRRTTSKYAALLAAFVMTAALAGCGSGNKEGSTSGSNIVGGVAKVDESACAQCHSTAIDPVAGTNIYQAYLASSHYTNNFHFVGCQDCHGGGAQHNGVGPLPYPNPDTAGKCFDCHDGHLSRNHFSNYSAAYVSSNYQKSCTSCHDPHLGNNGIFDGTASTVTMANSNVLLTAGTAKPTEHKDWAESGHGDVHSVAWNAYDFKNYKAGQSYTCIRCHTSTGYINYVEGSYSNPFPTTTWAKPGDTTKEVVTCKACHTDYNFKNRIRQAPQYTAHYGFSSEQASVTYPDVSTSNLCMPCHTGMINEASIDTVSDFTNASFATINPHYLAAAGVLFYKVGFRFYPSTDTTHPYDTIYGPTSHFAHDKVGVDNYAFPGFGSPTGTNGPCVSCHMNNGTHTLDYRQGYTDPNGICTKCHVPSAGHAMTDAIIEEEKSGFISSLALLQSALAQKGMTYTDHYPYFATTNWTTVGPTGGTGKQNMGAAFNFSLLKHEPGAFAHNRTYAKRLIYDSLDYLQNGVLTGTVNFTSYSSATVPVSGARNYLGTTRP
ncbi:cytochrome C [Geotalea uraniireducens]|uniref:Cytochrome C n=1 Tax=Geotalea uraniireducens TaxID=351604 RepID=A0ABM8EHN6_9BACT|nr:hypothetical protein [Geotalea uraniireducens]BDV41924.1 cytochrome C [Geotalea uraniireducens]